MRSLLASLLCIAALAGAEIGVPASPAAAAADDVSAGAALLPGESASGEVATGERWSVAFAGLAGMRCTVGVRRVERGTAQSGLEVRSPGGAKVTTGRLSPGGTGAATVRNLRLGATGLWQARFVTTPAGPLEVFVSARVPRRILRRGVTEVDPSGDPSHAETGVDLLPGCEFNADVRFSRRAAAAPVVRIVGPDGAELGASESVGAVARIRGVPVTALGRHRFLVTGGPGRFTLRVRVRVPAPRAGLTLDDVGSFSRTPRPHVELGTFDAQSADFHQTRIHDAACDAAGGTVVFALIEPYGDGGHRAAFVLADAATLAVRDVFHAPQDAPPDVHHFEPRVRFNEKDRVWAMSWIHAHWQQTEKFAESAHLAFAPADAVSAPFAELQFDGQPKASPLRAMPDAAAGGWLVAWTDSGLGPGGSHAVFAARVGADGLRTDAPVRTLEQSLSNYFSEPSGVQRKDGRFVVVYSGQESGAESWRRHWVTRRVLAGDGSDFLPPRELETTTAGTALLQAGALAANPADGSVLVAWTKFRVDGHSGGYPRLTPIARTVLLDGADALAGTLREHAPEGPGVAACAWVPARGEFVLAVVGYDESILLRGVAGDGSDRTAAGDAVYGDVVYEGFSAVLWSGAPDLAGIARLTRSGTAAGTVRFAADPIR